MTALPADVALYTQDGLLIRSPASDATAIRAAFPDAKDEEDAPRETFFRYEADAVSQEALRFAFLKRLLPGQDEIETTSPITFTLTPVLPKATVYNSPEDLAYTGIVRSFVYTTGDDRYALSLIEG